LIFKNLTKTERKIGMFGFTQFPKTRFLETEKNRSDANRA
jgi:hypothetical protein